MTGYTAGIEDGSITDFKTYALQCMRAFGVCANLREEPLSPDIPEVEIDTYHKNALEASTKALEKFNNATNEELLEEFKKHCDSLRELAIQEIERTKEINNRYNTILAEAKKFVPPTPDHENYKKFMVDQLVSSIDFLHSDYWERELDKVKKADFNEWRDNKYQMLLHDVEYHSKKLQEDIDRAKRANEWIRAAKQALENQENNK